MDYAFARGVFACLADGRLVILNVAADRYLMLPPDAEASLLRLIDGRPAKPGDHAVLERLCTRGLVLERASRPGVELCRAVVPMRSLLDEQWPRPRTVGVAMAALRVFQATAELKVGRLEAPLRRLGGIPGPERDDTDHVIGLAAAFAELRLLMRALDRCLPLSVALASSARRRHGAVRLVLGVRCQPFCAHAWVQLGATVLNDRLDTVRSFTPIASL